jgi:alpha-maltose-1-phosphate synthase
VRVLYLNYGSQSGVTASIATSLSAAGVEVLQANPTERFLWQARPGSRMPNMRPSAVRAFLESAWTHRTRWKAYWLHTVYAFDHMSDLAGEAIRRARPDAVLQSGVLFGPGPFPEVPYHLYLDHTRAIAERYEERPGLPPPVPYHPGWRAREQAVYRGATQIFTMSDFVKASLVSDYGVDAARIHVVGAGPNVSPRPGDFGVAREKAILFVGRTFVPKGGLVLLEAFERVRRVHPDAKLWIVSSSCLERLPPGAEFHGTLGPEGLRPLYARASTFVLPTLREAFGIVIVEAMTFGVPVVASRVEAIPEIVSHGETGLLVPPSDPGALARALCDVLGDPVRARLMGAAGRARATSRFDWDLAAAAMLERMRPASVPHGSLAQTTERCGA